MGVNNCLQALDLRNNQISHDSAAELCRALKQNHTIKALGELSFHSFNLKHAEHGYVQFSKQSDLVLTDQHI